MLKSQHNTNKASLWIKSCDQIRQYVVKSQNEPTSQTLGARSISRRVGLPQRIINCVTNDLFIREQLAATRQID